jgi:hypothetical protein
MELTQGTGDADDLDLPMRALGHPAQTSVDLVKLSLTRPTLAACDAALPLGRRGFPRGTGAPAVG